MGGTRVMVHCDSSGNSHFRQNIPFLVFLFLVTTAIGLAANVPPNIPIITEPATDGAIVNPADVHMETAPFSDPDTEDTHVCSDWEIWTVSPSERVWVSSCIGGLNAVHTHLGDGTFENSHTGRTELMSETDYRLLVRHRDSSGDPATEWSPWAERFFRTGATSVTYPLELDDIASTPVPQWKDENGRTIILPPGTPPPSLRIETPAASPFLEIRRQDGISNQVINPPAQQYHKPVRVVISASDADITLPQSQVSFTDQSGMDRVVYLPAVVIPAFGQVYYWISTIGSSYVGSTSQSDPNFFNVAQSAPVPWSVRQAGYKVEVVRSGFQLPINIAFVPKPGNQPNDPYFYVTELYGTINLVLQNGTVITYAESLLNFNPTGNFPGSGEQGLSGIVIDSTTGDVFAAMLYDGEPPDGPHYPKVVRFRSDDGGRTASSQTTILDMSGETQGESHFISNLSIGPDGKLYVHMGDGFDPLAALDLDSFRGKILRVNPDGTAPLDNQFYDSTDGINARDYVFAYGFRNPFGGAWRASDGFHYEVENGPIIDRFAKVVGGASYGWDGTDSSMTTGAIYNWDPSHAPVNIAFIQQSSFNGSGFPPNKMDRAFVTESGPTWASGPQDQGKRIIELELDGSGNVINGPTPLVEYGGAGKATAVGLAAGPDGLYFSDLYKDLGFSSPIDPGANILRVKYIGTVDFKANATSGHAPLAVQFTDQSNVPTPMAWLWDFGDSTTSSERNPIHVFTKEGVYNVRLSVTGANGVPVAQKNSYIIVGDLALGLRGFYYNNIDLTSPVVSRIDRVVDFDWEINSPTPSVGNNNFSVRWAGQVRPVYSETYTFHTFTDDGVRFWVNDQLLIDQWVDQSPTEHSTTIALQGGLSYDIRMEYYERDSIAIARLLWSSPSQPKEIIPQSRLFANTPQLHTPTLASPLNDAINQPTTQTLQWYPALTATSYRLQVSTDSLIGTTVLDDSTITETSRRVGPLASFTKYYWRVNAKNARGTSPYSAVWSFSSGFPLPAQVVLISPSNHASIRADSVRLVWGQSQPQVNHYWLEHALDSLFAASTVDSTLTDTSSVVRRLQNNTTYYWRVRASNTAGWGPFSETRRFSVTMTGVGEDRGLPREFSLSQNYPNPFNPSTTIEYGLPHNASVRLEVFNTLGQRVALLVNEQQNAGYHKVVFANANLASGVYFYRLQADKFLSLKKMLTLK